MRLSPMPAHHGLLAVLLIWLSLATVSTGQTVESAADRPLSFTNKSQTLSYSVKLTRNHFTGEKGIIVLDGGKERRCTLEIPAGCVLEDVMLHVSQGSELVITGALLRRCQIYAAPKSIITLNDSALDHCELTGFGESTKGFPTLKMVNCVFASGAILKPVNAIGLEMQDCAILDIKEPSRSPKAVVLGSATFPVQARNPRIRYTTFNQCFVNPTLFYAVSHCTFENCTTPEEAVTGAESGSTPGVTLPIRWVRGTPEATPQLGGGVTLQALADPIAGGCTLKYQWDTLVLRLEGVPSGTPAVPLGPLLPVSDLPVAAAPEPAPEPDPAEKAAMAAAVEEERIKLPLTHINGLLVMPLPSGKEAGAVTKMNLTALNGATKLQFNQSVGEDMQKALHEVEKFMILRHKGLPKNKAMEISFEEKYSGKDGPSAAVACALLIEGALTGKAWDPDFAVTGDLNADGAVQPIGGVPAKLRGATNGACKIIAVPAKNEASVADVLVTDGPGPLAAISVFSISKFEDATELANLERSPKLQQALTEMNAVRTVLMRDSRAMPAILKTAGAAARLQSILEKAPTCLSAKYLLLFAQGRAPTSLTIGGSIEATDNSGAALVMALKNSTSGAATSSLLPDELGGSLNKLRNLRPKIDKRVWPYLDSLVNFGDLVRNGMINPSIRAGARASEYVQKLQQFANNVNSAHSNLLADPRVREELGL